MQKLGVRMFLVGGEPNGIGSLRGKKRIGHTFWGNCRWKKKAASSESFSRREAFMVKAIVAVNHYGAEEVSFTPVSEHHLKKARNAQEKTSQEIEYKQKEP
jgi:hypothetical protein